MTRRAGMNEMNMLLSFLSCLVWSGLVWSDPALALVCEPSAPRTPSTSRGGQAARWARARYTTWHTACTSSTTS